MNFVLDLNLASSKAFGKKKKKKILMLKNVIISQEPCKASIKQNKIYFINDTIHKITSPATLCPQEKLPGLVLLQPQELPGFVLGCFTPAAWSVPGELGILGVFCQEIPWGGL